LNKFYLTLALALAACALVNPLGAWQSEGHNLVTAHAIKHLPEPLRSAFRKHKQYLQAHDLDPDRWKPGNFFEGPLHFIDLDKFGTAPRFTEIPRELTEAEKKFGKQEFARYGTVPWVIAKRTEQLVKAFKFLERRPNDQPLFEAAVLSHYVGDCHVPFHACLNYDGQLTNQKGIHARFEGEVVRRFLKPTSLKVRAFEPITGPVHEAAFGWSVESFSYVDRILKADAEAKAQAGDYNDAYYEAFQTTALPIIQQRIEQAAARLAALWQRAWEEAGKPDVNRVVVDKPKG